MKEQERVLISCGIVKEEIKLLIEKNKWAIKPVFLKSSLHVDFDKLWMALTKTLEVHKDKEKYVCYGTCHPLMSRCLDDKKAVRTNVQNCVELVLGKEKFREEIENGAFFLFEDWANNWENVTGSVFGHDPEVLKEIFNSEHKYLLGIKTPCSNDFSKNAEKISKQLEMPLAWIDADLDNLEKELTSILS